MVISTIGRRRPERAHDSYTPRLAGTVRAAMLGLVVAVYAASAHAATTDERSASILIFPKVVFDSSRDTLIQISNTSNSMAHAIALAVQLPICP